MRECGVVEEWRITTWNLQGSRGLDRGFVCAHINDVGPDVLALQEVTRRQARALSAALGTTYVWARKHTPFPGMSEGMAILTPHTISASATEVLTAAAPWSWRRRVFIRAHINRGEHHLGVLNVHLSPHNADEARERELARIAVVAASTSGTEPEGRVDVVVGDFNDEVSSSTAIFLRGGPADDVGADGPPTCWTSGNRQGRPPTNRLDGAIALGAVVGSRASTPTVDLDRWAKVSDHLPVTIDVRRDGRSATPA